MKEILILFQSISNYFGILAQLLPIIGIWVAYKRRLLNDNNMKIFAIYIIVAFVIRYSILFLSWYHYISGTPSNSFKLLEEWVFNIFNIFETFLFLYILLDWSGNRDYFFPFASIALPILLVANYFSTEIFPNLMHWAHIVLLLGVAFYTSFKIDSTNAVLKPEYSYLLIGIYLYFLISILGLAPQVNELHRIENIMHSIALFVSNYYFYRGFKCLYL